MKKIPVENYLESKTSKKECEYEYTDNIVEIKNCTILNLTCSYSEELALANLVWLCKDNNDELFILNTNYVIESLEDDEMLKTMIIHNTRMFVGTTLVTSILVDSLKSYTTDFEMKKENSDITMSAITSDKKYITLKLSENIFASMKMMDSFILEGITNPHDISLASISAFTNDNDSIEFVEISKIESIVNISKISKNDIGVIFRVALSDEVVSLLVPFRVEFNIKRKKFKGLSMDKIQETYMSDDNQYVNEFCFNFKFSNIDKDYFCIKGKNKNNISKLFLLDSTTVIELKNLIESYCH